MRKIRFLAAALAACTMVSACGGKSAGAAAGAETAAAAESTAAAGGAPAAESGALAESAAAAEDAAAEGEIQPFPKSGVSFREPASFRDIGGVLNYYDDGEFMAGEGVVLVEAVYRAMFNEEFQDVLTRLQTAAANGADEDALDEIRQEVYGRSVLLFDILGINGGRDEEQLMTYVQAIHPDYDPDGDVQYVLEQVGEQGDFRYYAFRPAEEQVEELYREQLGSFCDEYMDLFRRTKDLGAMLTFSEPQGLTPVAEKGSVLEFETTDLEGNKVSSKEAFARNKVTIVNLWMTWCPPCVGEMPELEKLSGELADKGIGVVGICLDGGSMTDKAKQIVRDTGVTFPVLTGTADIERMLPLMAYPTTYFVDAEGHVLGNPVVGANVPRYQQVAEELLAELE